MLDVRRNLDQEAIAECGLSNLVEDVLRVLVPHLEQTAAVGLRVQVDDEVREPSALRVRVPGQVVGHREDSEDPTDAPLEWRRSSDHRDEVEEPPIVRAIRNQTGGLACFEVPA